MVRSKYNLLHLWFILHIDINVSLIFKRDANNPEIHSINSWMQMEQTSHGLPMAKLLNPSLILS